MTPGTRRYMVLFITCVVAFFALWAVGMAFDHMARTWYPHHAITHAAPAPAR